MDTVKPEKKRDTIDRLLDLGRIICYVIVAITMGYMILFVVPTVHEELKECSIKILCLKHELKGSACDPYTNGTDYYISKLPDFNNSDINIKIYPDKPNPIVS